MTLLSSETVGFLGQLRANNDRQWFEAHKADYEAHLKRPGEAFASALASELEAATGESHEYRVFRIHRDVRFSRDKTPYNAHLHISLSANGGCRNGGPVWMFGLDPNRLTLGAGMFAFDKMQLDGWRVHVDGDGGEGTARLLGRLEADGVRIGEPELKRVPAPYPSDHARAALLRRKGLTAWIDCSETGAALGADGPALGAQQLLKLRDLFLLLRTI